MEGSGTITTLPRDGSRPEALGFEAEAIALRQLVVYLAGGRDRFRGAHLTAAASDNAVQVARAGVRSANALEAVVARMGGVELGTERLTASVGHTRSRRSLHELGHQEGEEVNETIHQALVEFIKEIIELGF